MQGGSLEGGKDCAVGVEEGGGEVGGVVDYAFILGGIGCAVCSGNVGGAAGYLGAADDVVS